MDNAILNEDFLEWSIYGPSIEEKRTALFKILKELTEHHATACTPYGKILDAHGVDIGEISCLDTIPFIPVRLFKLFDLKSVDTDSIFKVLKSSGTTGQSTSRIYLDQKTAGYQTKVLVRIMQEFLGKARLPMLIIDHPSVIKDRNNYSARGAGILGLSNFGRDHVYALRDDMSLDMDAVLGFCERYQGVPKFIFGFTFMIWQHFLLELERVGSKIDLANSIVVHSGGWKKLQDIAVDNSTFKNRLKATCGIGKVHNFYGMVEQVGSIFFECEEGHLHAPSFADIIVRDPLTWATVPNGQMGVVQVLSCLPYSYPGHSLLTEDLGTVFGEDDCPCGRNGRYFQIHGRIPRAEIRGCSDTQGSAVETNALTRELPNAAI